VAERVIRDFNGDNVWRDDEGAIWLRLTDSIRMQERAWDDAYLGITRTNPYRQTSIHSRPGAETDHGR